MERPTSLLQLGNLHLNPTFTFVERNRIHKNNADGMCMAKYYFCFFYTHWYIFKLYFVISKSLVFWDKCTNYKRTLTSVRLVIAICMSEVNSKFSIICQEWTNWQSIEQVYSHHGHFPHKPRQYWRERDTFTKWVPLPEHSENGTFTHAQCEPSFNK